MRRWARLRAAMVLTLLTVAAVTTVSTGTAQAGAGIWAGGYYVPDNAAVRENNSFAIYQVVNGGKLWIPNSDELAALGYSLSSVYVVPAGSLAAVHDTPNTGTLVRQRTDFAIYYIEDGTRFWITSPAVLEAAGYRASDARVVANGALNTIPRGPDVTSADFGGEVHVFDPEDVSASSGYNFKGTDVVHTESANGNARLVGGVNWFNGKGKFWIHRGNLTAGTKAYTPGPVGCVWAQVKFGYPTASVTFPPAASISGAAEVGEFYRSCRQGSESKPSAINLGGISFTKAYLNSVTVTVCTSATAAEGPRYCGTQKEYYA